MPKRLAYDPQPKRAPGLDEPIMVHLRTPPVDGVVQWHRHTWGQLACPRLGSIRVSALGMTWTVPMLRAVWIPPNVEHEVVMLGHVEFHALYFEPTTSPLSLTNCSVIEVSALIRTLIDSLAADSQSADSRTTNARTANSLTTTPSTATAHRPSKRRRLMTDLLMEEISSAPVLPFGLPLPSDRRLKALCDAMLDDPGSSRSLQEWAPVVGASERTLARLFQSDLQISFGSWRRQLRLTRAVDLICRGTPLLAVAEELGYANAGAFSTMFKRALGFPPSQLLSDSAQ
ncbi:helix-turn-helix domain-containing protein [Burkholderia sp. L27(2015)]|uniref:AraC family transcriptional regulator n=1 Tax=Burkholderia sp. L27(2015) TaxID=1641858 RepID=UPI00131A7B67|nr:helix-turn-helix transcriptional regulator [Burkholderia sp. L27(2015)]